MAAPAARRPSQCDEALEMLRRLEPMLAARDGRMDAVEGRLDRVEGRLAGMETALQYTPNMVQIATLNVGLAVGFRAIFGAPLGILTYRAP